MAAPPMCRQIAAGKRRAVATLGNLIAHQGWLSPEVSMAAVPELFDLAADLREQLGRDAGAWLTNALAGVHPA